MSFPQLKGWERRMKNIDKSLNITRNRILAACGAIVIVIAALLVFMNVNTNRITSQNADYLEGTTEQTTRRVNDLLSNGLATVQTAAKVYSQTLTSPNVDPRQAVQTIDSTQFNYTFLITADGMAYNIDGRTEVVTDREYYVKGMQGQSGVCAVENAAFNEHRIIAFYAPILYQGTPVAVFACVYNEDRMAQYMTTSFFGVQTATYLCDRQGSVLAKSSTSDEVDYSVLDSKLAESLSDISADELAQDFAQGSSVNFTYNASSGVGSACLTKLSSFDWMILRIFPESVTQSMVSAANGAGIILVAGVVLAGLLFIVVLVLQSRKQKDRLLLERQEATRIIDASTNLFNRLLTIDLANDSYEYLKRVGLDDSLPTRGRFSDLCAFWKDAANDNDNDIASLLELSDVDNLKANLTPDVPYLQCEYRVSCNGEDAWLQVSTLCIARDARGLPTDVLVTVQDVTRQKAAELASRQALEDAFQAAEHASQAKSDFLNSMSHDIRTPMNSIMGLTAIASMHADDPDRVRECLANITSASHHLLGLINEVLDMAKIESGSIGLTDEEFELSDSVEKLLTIVHPQIVAKNLDLRVDVIGIEHEHVIGDLTRLQQVFVNIMGNAIKFTPEGGSITMRITELESRVHGSGCYEFVFSDTGCGMSKEFMETIFEPFTRANDSRTTGIEGTGLGMAIVKSVVSMMSGSVEVDSELGKGTTFTVTVHLKLRDGAQVDLSDLAGIKVLVVDDDDVACEGACTLLEDIGMRAHYEMSGPAGIEAVVKADASDDPFQAVILDWRMPGMSGLEVARTIRERIRQAPPIIILSGYDWSMIEQEAREVGVDAFISKPLFRSRLIQVMKELMSGEVVETVDPKALLEDCAFGGYRVLLTEDNIMATAIGEEIIGLTGAEVEHAENGQVAVDMLLGHDPGYYDLVFMDIQMPVMNGYEATTAIRAAGCDRPDLAEVPIIALSADAFAEDVKHARSVGMNDHMAKPMEIESLVAIMRKWLSETDGE